MKIYWSNFFQDYIFENAFSRYEINDYKYRLRILQDEGSPKHTEYWELYLGHPDDLIFVFEVINE